MDKINILDKIITQKVYKKCIDKGFDTYSKLSVLLGTSESFVKAVFSSGRKKLNLYHILKFSYELNCDIKDLIPNEDDYKKEFGEKFKSEIGAFYLSIAEGE